MSRNLLRLRPRLAKPVAHPSPAFSSTARAQSTTSAALNNSTKPVQPSQSSNASASHPPPQTPITFPCLDKLELRTQTLRTRPPEPTYVTGPHHKFTSTTPLPLDHGGSLPEFTIAYETWGTLNADKSNLLLLFTGLSASSHAASNELNPKPGWWEKFIGPGKALDTSKYFVVCTNVLGGCFGSTGPSSVMDKKTGERWATRFPIVTLGDMVRAQWRLVDELVGDKQVTLVGASMGGMLSLAAARERPDRVRKVVSISACARSSPYSIAMRHTQRQVLISDPHYNRGNYYPPESLTPPHIGMKLARQIATITYRSGPEWELRFGRNRADPSKPPALCPDFLIETYLDHAGEKWCLEYDANSFLYLSKAMDLFDLGHEAEVGVERTRGREVGEAACSIPDVPYEEVEGASEGKKVGGASAKLGEADVEVNGVSRDLVEGMKGMKDIPALVMGVKSDILFPAWQQREIAGALKEGGNTNVKYVELGEDVSMFGHDTFLLDTVNVGEEVGRFLQE